MDLKKYPNTKSQSDPRYLMIDYIIVQTYCVNSQVADSACTATAYLCGVKNNKGVLGVTSKVRLSDCPASISEDNRVTSIMQWAQWAGKATGIVTTTRVTHASPAGTFAHIAHRDWESDDDMLSMAKDATNITQCEDIAKQLIVRDPGRNFKVCIKKILRTKSTMFDITNVPVLTIVFILIYTDSKARADFMCYRSRDRRSIVSFQIFVVIPLAD